ncbi:MAG: Re/Si-specific NAD(P)(+) transhydrogenase subunit alpha, partial [Microcella sp.]
MQIAIRREPIAGERRVAATPATVAQYVKEGYQVVVQRDAGAASGYPDTAYADAGATLVDQV